MITGKEALIALANGEEVQTRANNRTTWSVCVKFWTVNEILSYGGEFRLKPRTITLNGIEVPCCGENYQYGDAMYILNSLEPEEYRLVVLDKVDEVPAYWWRTEDEIKQVVVALREVLNEKRN